MIAPVTLYRYLAQQILQGFGMVLGVMLVVIMMVDVIELLRQAPDEMQISFALVMEMAFFRVPSLLEKIAPFAVLIGGMLTLTRLTRTQELVISRASGVSAIQFLTPAFMLYVTLGVFLLAVFNPISAVMLARYEQLEARYFSGKASLLAVSSSGLWLRQQDMENGKRVEKIVHALRISQKDLELYDFIIFMFDDKNRFQKRIDAQKARLEPGRWVIENALITAPNIPARRETLVTVPTTLTLNQLQDSFAAPETLSFWQLTSFIRALEQAGFSAIKHRMHWHKTLAIPFFLCAMIMIAATFALRLQRGTSPGIVISAGVFTGFVIYFVSDIIYAMGLSSSLPVALAAWAPTLCCLLVGVALLLHFEDG